MDRATAIRLLTIQFESGQRLLRARPLREDAHARWVLTTKNHLEKSLGRGSPDVWTVIDAGGRPVLPLGADEKWWETYRFERLSSQLRELAGVLNALGAEPKVAIPTLLDRKPKAAAGRTPGSPKSENPSKTGPIEPVAPPAQPEILWPTAAAEPVVPAAHLESVWTTTAAEPVILAPEPESLNATAVAEPAVSSSSQPERQSEPATRAPAPDYFTGIACLNGHVITGALEVHPGRAAPRCKECGAATFKTCRDCGVGLRGARCSELVDDASEPPWVMPNYCHSCGAAYPWTTLRREAIEATIAELLELETIERDGLTALVQDTILETPKTAVAVMRWQRALSKLTAPTRSLVTDVLKQAAVSLVVRHLGLTP